jgi:hypothetical protein
MINTDYKIPFYAKTAIFFVGFVALISLLYIAHRSIEFYTKSSYSFFDSMQAEEEQINITFINRTAGYSPKSEEFHWMANAAYDQSKQW